MIASGFWLRSTDISNPNFVLTHTEELEPFNRLTVDRERQIVNLKKSINLLLGELRKEPTYKSVE